MRVLMTLMLVSALTMSCAEVRKPEGSVDAGANAGAGDTLRRLAVAEGLAGPEGVRYDPELDVYFVSNFNGDVSGDANGFISRVGPDGVVLDREFMTGTPKAPLHGPRGMFLTGDTLWAADANGIHAFDRRSGAQIGFVDLAAFTPGFLNDIARGPDGALYVTDTDRSRIFRISGSEVAIVLATPTLHGPNGITWDAARGRFLLASWEPGPSVQAWRTGGEEVEALGAAGEGRFDGIEVWGDGILVASQRDSSVLLLTGGAARKLIALPGEPADFGVDTRRGRVAVPMVDRNQVEIWSLPAVAAVR